MATMTFAAIDVPLREDEYGAIRVGDARLLLDLVIHAFQTVPVPRALSSVMTGSSLLTYMPSSPTT